jgi:hypothetical protein
MLTAKDNQVRVVEMATGQDRATIDAPMGISKPAFSPDGQWFCLALDNSSSNPDGKFVRLYSARSCEVVWELAGEGQFLFGPAGQSLVTQGPRGLTFWELPPRKPLGLVLGLAALPALLGVGVLYLRQFGPAPPAPGASATSPGPPPAVNPPTASGPDQQAGRRGDSVDSQGEKGRA